MNIIAGNISKKTSRNSLWVIEFRNHQNPTFEEIVNYLTQNKGRNYFSVYLIQDVFFIFYVRTPTALYEIFLSLIKCSVINTNFGILSKKMIFTMILIYILK